MRLLECVVQYAAALCPKGKLAETRLLKISPLFRTSRRFIPEWRRWRSLLIVGLAILAPLAGYLLLQRGQPLGMTRSKIPAAKPEVASPAPALREFAANFGRNETISDALARHGLSAELIYNLVETTRPVYNLARVAAGRPYWLYLTVGGELHDFRYAVDDDRYLTVYEQDGRFVPVMKNFQYDTLVEPVAGVIEDSLFGCITAEGEQDILALQLADIFMYDVDFYTDVQRGDSFRMLVEKKYLAGRFVKYGAILAADFRNQGKTFSGFRFRDERGAPAYYSADGKALKKSFLKSPLKFARISSRFSRSRLHPILKIYRPHMGVDYAAPEGTPVQAVGAGTVEATGYQGEGGRMVKISHAGGYQTFYLHLSKILVKHGAHVQQGDVIGTVGASGLATGPHLDFRVVLHGKFINPTKVIFPPNPPVAQSAFTEFAALRDILSGKLGQVAAKQTE